MIGPHAELSTTTMLDPRADFLGNAEARDCRILGNSAIGQDALILGGTIIDSVVAGRTIIAGTPHSKPHILRNSRLHCKYVAGQALVDNCLLVDDVRVGDRAELHNVELSGQVAVYGDAVLHGPWALGGFARICAGTWLRAPECYDVHLPVVRDGKPQLVLITFTEGPPGKLMIDCKLQTFDRWLTSGPRYARRFWGWTDEAIEQGFEFVREWKGRERLEGKA